MNADEALRYTEALYGKRPRGRLGLSWIDRKGRFKSATAADPVEFVRRASVRVGEQCPSIYLRCTTLAAEPKKGERGGADLALLLPGLWSDLDYGTDGHKHDPNKHGGLALPANAEDALEVIRAAALPPPTLVVKSGGGLYAWWLLDQPVTLDAEGRESWGRTSAEWQAQLKAGARARGWYYGAGVGNLDRVLRLPGTVNGKVDPGRPCTVVQWDGPRYTAEALRAALVDADMVVARDRAVIGEAAATEYEDWEREAMDARDKADPGPAARLDAIGFEKVLTSAAWTLCPQTHSGDIESCFTRPGGGSTTTCSAHVLSVQPHVLVVHSEEAGLPTGGGQRLTPFRVFAHLHHGGDEKEAARDIREQRTEAAQMLGLVPARHPAPSGDDPAIALDRCEATFRRWLGDTFDMSSLHAQLAVMAVERMNGDPLWLMVISGSGNAKTESVSALAGGGAHVISTISSPAGLLSASPYKDRDEDATGGLLRKIGNRGVLVVKDFTSILSMGRDMRTELLAAFREIYDGKWDRNVGTDGGTTLLWVGRLGLVGAVTTAWDTHHAVIAVMGDRFALIRTDSNSNRIEIGRQATKNVGSEKAMRADLAGAVKDVLAAANTADPITLTDEETERLLRAADLVTRARSAVDRDYKGTPLMAHMAEAPTRFSKQLVQVVRGSVAVGLDRDKAMRLAIRCARDSVPPLRMLLLDYLAEYSVIGEYIPMHEIRKGVDKPRTTVDNELQAMHLLGLVQVEEADTVYKGRDVTRWSYRLHLDIDPAALAY
ncbi:MAG: hypothetical protein JO246_10360 [Frankiaceae bacterium]|nr:hypothetical protein [Frankiaceae bacterium]